jgi:hypothetical protein
MSGPTNRPPAGTGEEVQDAPAPFGLDVSQAEAEAPARGGDAGSGGADAGTGGAPPSRRGSWAGRLVRGGIRLVVWPLLVTVCAVVVLTQTDAGQSMLRTRGLAWLNENLLTGVLEIDHIDGTLIADLRLHGVRLRDPDGGLLVGVERIDLAWSPRALLDRRIVVDHVRIFGAQVRARVGADGALNLAAIVRPSEPSEPTEPGPPWTFEVRHASVAEGAFVLRDDRNRGARIVEVRALDLAASARGSTDGAVTVEVGHLRSLVAPPFALNSPTRVRLHEVVARLEGDSLAVEIERWSMLDSHLDHVAAEITLDPSGETLFSHLRLSLPDVVLDPAQVNPALPAPLLRAPLTLRLLAEGPVDAVGLHVIIEGETSSVEARFSFDLTTPSVPAYAGELELVRFRPQEWVALDGFDADLSLLVRATGRGITPDDASAHVLLDVAPSRVLQFGIEGVYASARYDEGRIALHALEAWADGATVRVSGEGDLLGAVEAKVDVSVAELAALARWAPELERVRGAVRLRADLATRVTPEDVERIARLELFDQVEAWVARTRASIDLTLSRVEVAGASVGRLRWTAESPGDGEAQLDARLRAYDVAVRGAPAGLRTGSVDVAWRGQTIVAEVRATDTMRRTLQTDFSVRLDGERLYAEVERLDASAAPVNVRLLDPIRLRVDGAMSGAVEGVEVDPFGVSVFDQRVEVGGAWRSSGTWRGRVVFRRLDVATVVAAVGDLLPPLPDLRGRLSVDASASGAGARPEFRVRAELEEGGIERIGPLEAVAEVSYLGRRLRAQGSVRRGDEPIIEIDTGETGIPLDVWLDGRAVSIRGDEAFSLAAQVPPLALGPWVELFEELDALAPRGTFSLSLDTAGTIAQPYGLLRLRLDDGEARVDMGDGATTHFRGIGGGLALEVSERAPDELQLKSEAIWNGRRVAQISGRANLALRDVIEGSVPPAAWARALQGELDVLVGPLRIDELPEAVRRTSGVANGTVNARLMLRGGVDGGRLEAFVNLFDLIIDGVPQASVRLDLRSEERTEAAVRVVAGNTYSARRWTQESAWDLESPVLHGPASPDVAAARLVARSEQGLRELVGAGPRADARVEARLHVEHLAPVLFQPSFDAPDVSASGWVDLAGPLVDPSVHGRFALDGLTLLTGEPARLGIEVERVGQRIEVFAAACASDVETVRLEAWAVLPRWPIGDGFAVVLPDLQRTLFHVALTAHDAPLEGLVPAFATEGVIEDLRGTLNANVEVSGTVDAPVAEGTIELEGVSFALIPLNRSFDRVDATVRWTNDYVSIEPLVVRDGAGSLELEGRVDLASFRPSTIDLRMELERFYAAGPTGPGAYVDGVVRVQGQERAGVLGLDVLLSGMSVVVPEEGGGGAVGPTSLPETIHFIDETVDLSQVGLRAPLALGTTAEEVAVPTVSLAADVRVRTTGTNRIEHTMARLEFATDVSIRARPDGVLLSGFVSVPGGRISVAGRSFEIARGYVQLSGDLETLDPVVDLRAVHNFSPAVASRLAAPSGDRATVTIVVDGQVSDLLASSSEAIRLQSDPEMPPEDVIFVLFTGRPRDENTEADGQQQALATAGSLLLGVLGDRLAGGSVIDTLSIEGDAQSGQAIARVEGGKYLSEDLYLSGAFINSQDPEDNNFEVALQWIIARFRASSVRTELRAGNRARGGVELLYFFSRRGRSRVGGDE